jgi:hypothetical protein
MPSRENFIYVIVVYLMDPKSKHPEDPKEMHNHGWFKELADAEEYMKLAGQPVPGHENGYYDDPFEQRWSYAMIEKVSEGTMCHSEVIHHYKAEWYLDPDYEYDDSVTELVNKMRQRKFRVVEIDEPPFDASHSCGFAGF